MVSMQELDLIEIYKKEIEVFLGTMSIHKGDKIINNNSAINAENKEFIRKYMQKMFANNLNVDILNKAIDELLPYLYQK